MPQATFTHTAHVEVNIEMAWAALQSHQTWSNIGPVSGVSNPVNQRDGVLKSFDWVADLGGKAYAGKAWATAYEIPSRYELTMDNSEIAGDVVTTLASDADGCNVTIAITFRTKGMLSAMFFPAIKSALASGFPQQVDDLARVVESTS